MQFLKNTIIFIVIIINYKDDIMNYNNILEAINDVNQRLECEYTIWNETNDSYIIEECIWNIKSLEIKRNNLYTQAKEYKISFEDGSLSCFVKFS